MSIVLNWKPQPGQTLDSIEIYRYVNPRQSVNPNAPGTPLVVLPGNTTSYEDTTTASWATYQYRIVSVKGTDKVMGMPIVQGDFPYTGPGPQKLIRGDWWRGYFGTLTANEFILSAAELNGLIGFNAWNQNVSLFHKFVFKGRVLFIPDTATKSSTTWREQYNQGLMWGTNDNGARIPYNVSGTNQYKTFNKNGYEYVLRLPRFADYTASPDNSNYYGSPSGHAQEGEWWNTIDSLYRYSGWVRRFGHIQRTATGTVVNAQGSTLFANGYNNQYGMVFLPGTPSNPTYVSMDSFSFVQHVIELVLN